ncbi:PepSY domain-containing protein [Paenibacillus crassostreae]|uniref:PepSY domain-containing protein n=1 Tax=Paenibacillus crassostreae TaxID=1763538 RepID=A0A167AQD4_9BACL|nr:PepSY domain-containing protein [Paenibacillus crassostreae]AOZ93776.1 hypothetical protein LPB68_17320 [Paenibacillus crassostreae]OAB71311.1 hypothetical protein PNBC_20190 [Paenibacillus crassostreae]
MNNKIVRLSIIVLIILGITTVGIVWKSWASSAVLLSEEEAIQIVLAQYPGEVIHSSLKNDEYVIQNRLVKGLYELRLNASEGTITSIVRLEAVVPDVLTPEKQDSEDQDQVSPDKILPDHESSVETPVQEPDADITVPTKKPTSDVGEKSTALVSRDQAAVLALKHVSGTVQSIEIRGTDSNSYYLVKMNTKNHREAVVQVNGISGAIMSVTWDDKDDRKGKNDRDSINDTHNQDHRKVDVQDNRGGKNVNDQKEVIDKK